MYIPVINAWQLNERHYGALTGLNKQETLEKYGREKVMAWRRSYDIPPPPLDPSSPHYPGNDVRYAGLDSWCWPTTESLKMTLDRVLPYWGSVVAPTIKSGKRVLIAAHGNSLRALVKHLDDISEVDIPELNIPTGVPLVYELDDNLKPIKHVRFPPDPLELDACCEFAVANSDSCVCVCVFSLLWQRDAIAPLSGRYLGDQDAVLARIQGVKQQTK